MGPEEPGAGVKHGGGVGVHRLAVGEEVDIALLREVEGVTGGADQGPLLDLEVGLAVRAAQPPVEDAHWSAAAAALARSLRRSRMSARISTPMPTTPMSVNANHCNA